MKKQKITQKDGGKKTNYLAMLATLVVAALAFIPATAALAWGPERETYTMEKPADHVTFNSITNNSTVGDERNFVHIKEKGAEKYSDSVVVEPGKEYIVYITYHNDAASNLNASGVGVATGVRVRSQFPTKVTPEKKGQISAVISATNAEPKQVWDEAFMTTTHNQVLLRYKEGSAVIHNGWATNGRVLSEKMFESGTYLGMDELDGVLLGCAEYGGYITYTLEASNVGAEINKTVSNDGGQTFHKNVTAKPGDEVTFQVDFKNTGTRDLTNVGFHDVLPEGLSLVSGTTYLYDNTYPNGEKLSDLIDKNGYTTGGYGDGGYVKLLYKTKVSEKAECGGSLVNRIYMDSDQGEISDGATVNVVCDNNDEPQKETPQEEEPVVENNKNNGSSNVTTPGSLPNTGPVEVGAAIVIVAIITVLAVYWFRSYVALQQAKK